ncbi:MAG TPA: Rnf-Nqr domain containing protein, partial [Candidatus Marinimicrobia bacterium]|nr:Rnf-Nqr domain containing protein [Candidatus Neomarinimicrobiota bacterium]
MNNKSKQILTDPLMENNPITLQVLGICSALAVTVKMDSAVVMTLAVVGVLSISNTAISILRNFIPRS